MVDRIIRTKCVTPTLKEPLPSPERRLKEEELSKKMLHVTGGPGTGKTTLAASSLHVQNKRVKWLTLDAHDNALTTFWHYMMYLFEDDLDTHSLEDLRNALNTVATYEDFQKIVPAFINQLMNVPLSWVVLDDFHHLNDKRLLESFETFLRHAPATLHFVTLSREKSPLSLHDMLMKGDALVLGKNRLSFDDHEAHRFLTHVLQKDPGFKTAKRWNALCEGWPGGLQLLALGGRLEKTNVSLNQETIDYLRREVFDTMTEAEQDLLVSAAPLDYIQSEIANVLLEIDEAETLLETLAKRYMFISTDVATEKAYRVHSLFRSYMRTLFEQLPSERQSVLRRRIAEYYLKRGETKRAFEQLLILEDYKRALSLLREEESLYVYEMLQQVPVEEVLEDIPIAFELAFYSMLNHDIQKAERIMKVLEKHSDPDVVELAGLFNVVKSQENLSQLRVYEKDGKTAQRLMALVEKMNFSDVAKIVLQINTAVPLFYADRFLDAIELLEQSKTLAEARNNPHMIYFTKLFEAQIHEHLGHLKLSSQRYTELHDLLDKHPYLAPARANLMLGEAGVDFKRLDLKSAEERIEKAAELRPDEPFELFDMALLLHRMELSALRGNTEDARAHLDNILKAVALSDSPFLGQSMRYILLLDFDKEKHIEDFLNVYKTRCELGIQRVEDDLANVEVHIVKGESERVEETLKKTLETMRREKKLLYLTDGLLLKAAIASRKSDMKTFDNTMLEALYYAHSQDIQKPFIFRKAELRKHLPAFERRKGGALSPEEKRFVKKVSDKIGLTSHNLSPRELDVLKVLATGASNKEIAETLHVSLATVKTHINNIYAKLSVRNRVQAIEKAKNSFLTE